MLRRGCRVTVLTQRLDPTWPRFEVVDGVEVRRRGRPGYGRAARATAMMGVWLWLVMKRTTIDTIHILMDPDYDVVAWAAGLSGRTIFTWAGRGDPQRTLEEGPPIICSLRRRALRRSANVALTGRMADELAKLRLECTAVIPVPVDVERFRPGSDAECGAARAALGIGDSVAIIFTGHMHREKGVDRLLKAFRCLVAEGLDARLLLVGGGKEGSESNIEAVLRRAVHKDRLERLVTMTGAVPDVLPYLHAADIFVLPSDREGMPNSLLEAMACGLPCVAPASAAGDEVLSDGAGIVPPSNSPGDLIDTIRPLVVDPRARHTIGALAQEKAWRWSVPAIMDSYQLLYRERRKPRIRHLTARHRDGTPTPM